MADYEAKKYFAIWEPNFMSQHFIISFWYLQDPLSDSSWSDISV